MSLALVELTNVLKEEILKNGLVPYFYEDKPINEDDENYEIVMKMAQGCCSILYDGLRHHQRVIVRKDDGTVDYDSKKLDDEKMIPHLVHVKRAYNHSPAIQLYLKKNPQAWPILVEAIKTAPLEHEAYKHKPSIDKGHIF